MKHVLMLPLLMSGSALAVVATGHGATYDEALTSAKIYALEKKAGTMVLHSSTTTDNKYTQTTKQYTGGVVVSYKVLHSEVLSGVHHVTIDADIKSGKNNVVVGENLTDQEWILRSRAAAGNARAQKQFATAFDDLPAFVVTSRGRSLIVRGQQKEVRIKYAVTWQPKMLSDIREYADLSGTPLKLPSVGIGSGLAALIAAAKPITAGTAFFLAGERAATSDVLPSYTLCFGTQASKAINVSCHGLASSIPGIDRTYVVRLRASVGDQPIEREVVLQDSELRRVSPRGTVIYKDGIAIGEFLLYLPVDGGDLKIEQINVEPHRPARVAMR